MWPRSPLIIVILSAAIVVAALYVTYRLVDPLPPRHFAIAAGAAGSGYDNFARQYARILARQGVELEIISKRGNSLRVMAEAVRWGKRGARVNTISPGIIMTPLAKDELSGPRGEGYRRMIKLSAVGRVGTPDEVGTVAALLMGRTVGSSLAATFLWMAV